MERIGMTNTTSTARAHYAGAKADHVGSFLRPQTVKAARADFAAGKISQEALREIENAAIITLIQQQKDAGMLAITDGEVRRAWWHFDFMENLGGAEGYEAERGMHFHGVTTKPHNVRVVDRIRFDSKHPHLKDFAFLFDQVGASGCATAKMTIPSPNMMMRPIIRNNAVYGNDFDRYVEDVALAYRDAVKAFYDLGCRYLQIDDVFWAYLVDAKCRAEEAALGMDLDRLAQACTDTLNIALQDKPDDLVIGMHICRGNFSSTWHYQGGYDAIDRFIFKGLKQIDRYFLEYDDARSGTFAPLAQLADTNAEVILGLITTKTEKLEARDNIIARIHEAEQYLPLSQLALSPQCGFSSTEEGNRIDPQIQWNKLHLVKSIADEIWG
jgi:5-methyltetrahydropteroyltriglutamate--homocysteine methyltransferase